MAQPNLIAIITSVSTSLNDQETGFPYVRWSIAELTGYLNESLLEILNYRPDAFTVTRSITLGAGAQQTINGIGSFLKSIDTNDPNGSCGAAGIVECDLNLMRTFYKAPCLPSGGASNYRVLSYAYDAKNPLTFYVSPDVPAAGPTINVVGTVIVDPTQWTQTGSLNSLTWNPTSDLTLDQKYFNTVKFWMLARTYEVDTESNTSQAESQGYYKKFYNSLGIQYKQGSDYSRGKFIGQGGDNQMSKERVA